MTVEDHSGDNDRMPTAGDEADCARWRDAYKEPENAPVRVSAPTQKSAPISRVDRLWEERFDELAGFYLAHEHLRITKTNAPSPAFYRWLLDQRMNLRQGKLSPARQERLDSLGFRWLAPGRIASSGGEHHEAGWLSRYAELCRFKDKHGHCQVEIDWAENPALGRWVQRQRGSQAKRKIRQGRLELLESIGFAWESEKLHLRNLWETRFSQMAEHIRQQGDDRMTQSKEPAPGLYHWGFHQRHNFLQGKLRPDRQARLEAIGFTFGGEEDGKRLSALEELWKMRFAELLRFKEQHGHAGVPTYCKENPKVGNWVSSQRHLYGKGQLSADRVERLDAIGFVWKSANLHHSRTWDAHFARLVEFKRVHGHDIVTESDDPVLYIWRRDQRKYFRRGTLSPERMARLNAIGFGWTTTGPDRPAHIAADDAIWNEKLRQLQAVIAQDGHSLGIRSHSDSLAHWAKKQRRRQRDGTLRADRKQRLDEAGFGWQIISAVARPASKRDVESTLDSITLWEEGFAALQVFKREHGHMNVPDKDPEHRRLAEWLRQQHIGRKRGSLLFSQVSRLEQLGVRWQQG